MKIFLDINGTVELERTLLRWADRAMDASPVWPAIADYWRDEIKRQFDSDGAHATAAWQPLAESTIMRKKAAGMDNGILRATRALEESLTERNNSNTRYITDDSFMVFGSELPYLAYHQQGRGVPERKPVALTRHAASHTAKMLQDFLLRGEVRYRGAFS